MKKGLFVAIAVFLSGSVVFFLRRDQSYDRSFDTRVSGPAYRANGPTVLFDEGHKNTHTTDQAYKPFAGMLRNDGYSVRVSTQPIARAALNGVSILVLAVAQGANDTNDSSAYSDAETAAVEEWVRGGGSLLLVTDHWPYGLAVASLGRRFGVSMGGGLVEDTLHYERGRGPSHIIFSAENGLLHDHPIVRGRNSAEQVRRVLTFTGQSVRGPVQAVSFMELSSAAVERPPKPATATSKGGDKVVSMMYGDPIPTTGAQGVAFEYQKGRVVVLGEAGMLRAQRERNGNRVGMNVPGYDNRQLALNIIHWLSRII